MASSMAIAGFERPLTIWHRGKDGRSYCKQIHRTAERWFRRRIDTRFFSEPSVMFDAAAFRSVMKSSDELVLVDQEDGSRFLFLTKKRDWFQSHNGYVVINLARAEEKGWAL